jgi:tRNA(fMet)-specific endonuclease VapC
MGVILDSSVLIAAERRRFNLVSLLEAHPTAPFFTTAVTASELLHGCVRASDAATRERRTRFVEGVLQDYAVLPFTLVEAREHARIWADLEARGVLIGERDLLIAAIARTTGHSVATLNRSEFERVPGLVLLDTEGFVTTPT